MELEGKHVVVTGAGRGIGRALALRFADEGARAVVVSDMDEANARQVAREVGGQAITADVGREQDIRKLINRAEGINGPIDLFFSNAGITGPSGGPEILDADWDLLWRVNTMSHVWAARALLPGMLERGDGYLCSTASAAGLLAQLGAIGYTVTKHAAVAVAEWLSMTYGDRGIKVSCLCPQYVRTPMVTEGELPVEKLEQVATDPRARAGRRRGRRGDPRGAAPGPPASRGRDLHEPPRRRPRALAPGNAPVAGISSGVEDPPTGTSGSPFLSLTEVPDGAVRARRFPHRSRSL